jgi:hypothetical protein
MNCVGFRRTLPSSLFTFDADLCPVYMWGLVRHLELLDAHARQLLQTWELVRPSLMPRRKVIGSWEHHPNAGHRGCRSYRGCQLANCPIAVGLPSPLMLDPIDERCRCRVFNHDNRTCRWYARICTPIDNDGAAACWLFTEVEPLAGM